MKTLTPLLISLLFLFLWSPAEAANTAPAEASILPEELSIHIEYMAHDDRKGRDSGTPGLREAAAYLEKAFTHMGLKPMGDKTDSGRSWLQKVPIVTNPEPSPEKTFITLSGQTLAMGKDYTPFHFSGDQPIENKEIVFAGYGITNEKENYNDYADLDVKGKVVLIFRYDHSESSGSSPVKNIHARFSTKSKNAADRGAAGLLIVNGPLSTLQGPKDELFGNRNAGVAKMNIPAAHISRKVAESLLKDSGKTLTQLQRELDDKRKPVSFSVPKASISMRAVLEPRKFTSNNVVAVLEGSHPTLKDEYVVLGAHYDHVGMGHHSSMWGVRGYGQIHNGADDNASGVSAILEAAQAFTKMPVKPSRSVLFILFCGEERGLLGSKHFVANPTVPKEQLTAMINADMVGRSKNGKVEVWGVQSGEGFEAMINEHNVGLNLDIVKKRVGVGPSDHAPFFLAGVPVLFYFTGLHDQYHTPDDDIELINYRDLTKITTHIFRTAWTLANLPDRPAFNQK